MVVYECAVGKFPFPSLASFPVLFDYLCNLPEPRLDITSFSGALCNFVGHCLQRDPLKRLSAVELSEHVFLSLNATSDSLRSEFSSFLKQIRDRRNS
jgi:serine/threonine protein kinase